MSATVSVKPIKDRTSSPGQKFWPLKKFNLSNHGKTVADQPKKSPTIAATKTTINKVIERNAAAATITTTTTTIAPIDTDDLDAQQQKKSKNKRLSSLLSSSRRQEDESISKNASNTPTITRKAGRDSKPRSMSKNSNYMTAKPAGSGTFTRTITTMHSPPSLPTATAVFSNRAQPMPNKTTAKRPSKHTRSHSPPTKQHPTTANEQPTIMLESVQQQIQQDEKEKMKRQKKASSNNSSNNNEDYDSAIEDGQEDELIHVTDDNSRNNIKDNKGDAIAACILLESHSTSTSHSFKSCSSNSICSSSSSSSSISSGNSSKEHASPLPSPPITPAATSLPDEFTINDSAASTGIMNLIHSKPVSPTLCIFDVQSVQQQQQQQQQNQNSQPDTNNNHHLYVQQPIQRIHRLRPAASFATLRQLATTNSNYQHQQQQLGYNHQHVQHLAVTTTKTAETSAVTSAATSAATSATSATLATSATSPKRRPVSYIEPSCNVNYNYAIAPAPSSATTTNDDYLSAHHHHHHSPAAAIIPTYFRRASSEDNHQHNNHSRRVSDSNPSPPASIVSSGDGRRLVRSSAVHNLIIKDGQGHRIIQCVGLDDSPPLQPLRQKGPPTNLESASEYQDWLSSPSLKAITTATAVSDVVEDDTTAAIVLTRQQQQIQAENDTSCDQQHTQPLLLLPPPPPPPPPPAPAPAAARPRKMKRKDSSKSLSSLCSSSPTINQDNRCEQLKNKLDKERATVKALQKQKEAYNKDVLFLSNNVDELSADNLEWKRKFDVEKTSKERFQDDLSSTMDKLNEATEQIRQLELQNRLLKQQVDDKNRELEKKSKPPVVVHRKSTTAITTTTATTTPTEKLLSAQLQHSQNQVRLLKSTMEQFLRMGVFNDDLSNMTSPTTSIDAVVSELRCGRSRQRRHPASTATTAVITNNTGAETITLDTVTAATAIANSTSPRKSLVPVDTTAKDPTNKTNKSTPTAELDNQLLELLREKEILQAEYSKAPSSGGNALVRRRREELEARLDAVDSQMCRIKLKMRNRNLL